MHAIDYDHPELYYANLHELQYSKCPKSTTIRLQYKKDQAHTSQIIETKVATFLSTLHFQDSDRKKYLAIHDFLIRSVKYLDNTLLHSEQYSNAFSIIGPLCDGGGVCEGIAKSFKYLCDLASLPAIIVSGQSSLDRFPFTNSHAWNIVYPQGKPAHLDVTWDICNSAQSQFLRYDYFCISDYFAKLDHKYNGLPVCPDLHMDYFQNLGLHFHSSSELQQYLIKSYSAKSNYLYFRVSSRKISGDQLIQAVQVQVRKHISQRKDNSYSITAHINETQLCFLFSIHDS